jgi:hypothetical protein
MSEIVFFYSSDQEILELSEFSERPTSIVECLDLELRLLVLLIPLDGYVVFPPSHFLESPICRLLVLYNLPFISEGYVRLMMRESTLSEHLEKEREEYKPLSYVEKYKQAYYSGTDYGIRKLPFVIVPKGFLTGKTTLDVWERRIRNVAHHVGYPQELVGELIRRVREDEDRPFVWELIQPALRSIRLEKSEERRLGVRAAISRSYLEAHRSAKILLPSSSMVVRDIIVPRERKYNAYDLFRFRQLLQVAGVFERVADFGAKKILRLKFKVPHVIDQIRQRLSMGSAIEEISSDLKKRGLMEELEKAVQEISSGGISWWKEAEGLQWIGEKPRISFVSKELTGLEWVRVAAVQLEYELELGQGLSSFSLRLKTQSTEGVRKKVFRALEIAENEKVGIVCFPELAFLKEWVDGLRGKYRGMVIVCGSYYEDSYNVCPIVIDNEAYFYRKVHPSLFESTKLAGWGMKPGETIFIFQTRYGKISVLLCIDYTTYSHKLYGYRPDIVLNPCYDERILRFQERASLDARDYEFFVIQANRAKYGETCIIGKEHRLQLDRLRCDGFKPDDQITYKLCQATGEMIIIADINIRRKAPSIETPVNYEGIIKNISKQSL